jgi:cytoskeletal protein RodZ
MGREEFTGLVGRSESVGAALMYARMASNLSIAELAERTKVSTRFLHALEQDDFSVFVSRVYIVGFAKAYAKVVGLDIEGVVASLGRQLSPEPL